MIGNYPHVVVWQGREWAVSSMFHAATIEPWPELEAMDHDEIYVEIYAILRTSEDRALEDQERLRLDAYVKNYNLRNNLVFLQGRSIEDFNFAYHDQCHGMRGTFECGCQLHYVFDHYLAMAIASASPPALVVNGITDIYAHPHYPRYVCPTHRHLINDLTALDATVRAEFAEVPPIGQQGDIGVAL